VIEKKIKILVENQNFGRKSKFWSKIKILVEIKILVKNQNFGQKSKFGEKSKFRSNIKILVKNQRMVKIIINFLLFWNCLQFSLDYQIYS